MTLYCISYLYNVIYDVSEFFLLLFEMLHLKKFLGIKNCRDLYYILPRYFKFLIMKYCINIYCILYI